MTVPAGPAPSSPAEPSGTAAPPAVAAWVDGALRAPDEARVSVLDHGFLVGDGVFETCGVVRGQAFALTRHLRRLGSSARGLGLREPQDDVVREAIAAVLGAAPGAGRLRITLTSGPGPLGSARGDGPSTLVVTAGPVAAGTAGPTAVVRLPWVRNERSAITGLKSTSYAENARALAWARERGASEGIMANSVGRLCEATAANVFVERDGELLTPALSSGCLAGVTRDLVLEWGQEARLPVREAQPDELPWSVLDEVLEGRASLFLTGSVRGIVPVGVLDGVEVRAGEVGTRAREVFDRRRALDVDP